MSEQAPSTPHRRVRRAVLVVVGLSALLMAVQLGRAVAAARSGEHELRAAKDALRQRHVSAAQVTLTRAERHFQQAKVALDNLGPLGYLASKTPLVRVQLRAARDLVDTGQAGARAALTLSPVLQDATTKGRQADQIIHDLAAARPLIHQAVQSLADVSKKMDGLRGYRLLWPLNHEISKARTDLSSVLTTARRAEQGLTVLLDLSGADGTRRYLLLSQNPDEVRPTGGFMGTYGVTEARHGKISLVTYGATERWTAAHPSAYIPVAQAPFLFRYVQVPQDLSNAATLPDWPSTAQTAAMMWSRGGEPPADGVLTFTPALLVRLVGVLGPTRVPGYPDVLTAANVDERIEYYTHGEAAYRTSNRKKFIGDLARVVLDHLLHAPTTQLPTLLSAVSEGLNAGEGAMWSQSQSVQDALHSLAWDGAFPSAAGDFYADAEFALASKNGRGLQRTFHHTVTLASDGSGTSDTVMVLRDTLPFEAGNNVDSSAYLTPYGPRGGRLDAASDPPDRHEPDLDGHPTAGWLRSAPPEGSTRLHVRWQSQDLAVRRSDGTWDYHVTWLPTPGHSGDVLTLSVTLPAGAHWLGTQPPALVPLNGPFKGKYQFTLSSQ